MDNMENVLQKRIKNLTDEELRQAFDEILSYNRTATFGRDTLVRNIRNEYAKNTGIKSWDMNCLFTCNEITFEIAKRHYNITEARVVV